MNQYSLMCAMLPKNRVDEFMSQVDLVEEEWEEQRELTEEEKEEWYEEPKELEF